MLDLWLGRKIKRVCWRVCGGGRERERENVRGCKRVERDVFNYYLPGSNYNFSTSMKNLEATGCGSGRSRVTRSHS